MIRKEYVYKVYNADNTYRGVWRDVISEPNWSQRINTPGTTMQVRVGRSANRTDEVRDTLATELPEPLTDEGGDSLIATYRTSNTIGEDTDVDLNYNVDVYVVFGDFEGLTTETGEQLLTEASEDISIPYGAPLGRRIFSGFILDYSAAYGNKEFVEVTLASNGFGLSHEIIKPDASDDTTYLIAPNHHDTIMKLILDVNPGAVTYSIDSIDPSPSTFSYNFQLNTKLEGIQQVYLQSDDGWYWFGNVADNLLYFKQRHASADHVFVLGQHIGELKVKRSMEDLRNVIYFIGGDVTPGVLQYKKYDDPASIAAWRQGVFRINNLNFFYESAMAKFADKIMARYGAPIYTTELSIPSEVYDIETLQLGQTVGFSNFGNFVDDLVLQIVSLTYTPHLVTISLGDVLDRYQDILDDTGQTLRTSQNYDIPSAPS